MKSLKLLVSKPEIIAFVIIISSTGSFAIAGNNCAVVRSQGMAGAYNAVGSGCEAAFFNPALTGAENGTFMLLPSISAELVNSTLSVAFYNDFNGRFWDEEDKKSILERIPEGGMRIDAGAQFIPFALRFADKYSFFMDAGSFGSLKMSKDLADLVLYGNEPGRSYLVTEDNTNGRSIGYMEIGGSRSFQTKWSLPDCSNLVIGFSCGLLYGLAFVDVPVSNGKIYTNDETGEIIGDGEFRTRWSLGGYGFTSSLGAATVFREKWNLSFAIKNLPGIIIWKNENGVATASVHDTLTGMTTDEEESSDLFDVTTQSEDTGSFSSGIPVTAALGGSVVIDSWLLASDLSYEQYDGVRLSGGFEYTPSWRFLRIRAGAALGGPEVWTLSAGFGFVMNTFAMDFSVANHHGLFGGARGVSLGLGLSLL